MIRLSPRSILAALFAALCVAAPVRAAETAAPPSHLTAYNLDWLNYLDPADVPATRSAICLVDSGVRETPDTPATSPDGPIIARLAVDGGSGKPEGDTFEHLHGTRMAMAMAAPQNGWGTIGAWSGARIVSVRGTTAGESDFRPEYYEKGIRECIRYQLDTGVQIAVINLSLGCGDCMPTAEQRAVFEDRVAKAHGFGISVLAAAGNDGRDVQYPAALPEVFAVAAGDPDGAPCSYASFGPAIAVVGPACPVELADPATGRPILSPGGGSSAATAITSTLMSALRTLQPAVGWYQVEDWIRGSARTVDGRRTLDGEAAAQYANLGEVVARARGRQSPVAETTSSAQTAPVTTPLQSSGPGLGAPSSKDEARRLPRPKVAIASWRKGRLIVRVINRPPSARLGVEAERLRADGLRTDAQKSVICRSGRVLIRTRWRPDRIRLRYLFPAPLTGRRGGSAAVIYRHGSRYF